MVNAISVPCFVSGGCAARFDLHNPWFIWLIFLPTVVCCTLPQNLCFWAEVFISLLTLSPRDLVCLTLVKEVSSQSLMIFPVISSEVLQILELFHNHV